MSKRDPVTRQYHAWTHRHYYDPQVPLDDMDLPPRTRRAIAQLGAAQQTHAKTWSELGAIPGLEPFNVTAAPRSASDL
eukprot:6669186-Alexandrium_andersonii.AAC.1